MDLNDLQINNAQIAATQLGYDDHGIVTAFLQLRWPGMGGGFGGYVLHSDHPHSGLTAFGMQYLRSVLDTVGVRTWEDLAGKHVRIVQEPGSGLSRILGIGNIMEDRWFFPHELGNDCEALALERQKAIELLAAQPVSVPAPELGEGVGIVYDGAGKAEAGEEPTKAEDGVIADEPVAARPVKKDARSKKKRTAE